MTVAPENILLLKCPDCSRKRTVEPDNALYATGGLECPECSTIYKSLAKYERVEVSIGENDNE